MKKSLILVVLLSLNINSYESAEEKFNDQEITYVVEMNAKKSSNEINRFSEFYQKLVERNEPDTFAWQFFRSSDNKIFLIERYKNSISANQHIVNISPGGISEEEFGMFSEHFKIEKIIVHGFATDKLKDSLKEAGFSLEFRSPISGYSRK